MTQLFVYALLFGLILYGLSTWGKRQSMGQLPDGSGAKPGKRFRGKPNPQEVWVQVYETKTVQEARMLQARLQEEDLDCIVYEQGKKDIHGNEMKGVGIAVPKTAAPQAQGIISRMPI